jgi:hypothetical protein
MVSSGNLPASAAITAVRRCRSDTAIIAARISPSSLLREPMVKLPAGTTTISGQLAHSLNVSFGLALVHGPATAEHRSPVPEKQRPAPEGRAMIWMQDPAARRPVLGSVARLGWAEAIAAPRPARRQPQRLPRRLQLAMLATVDSCPLAFRHA